MPGISKYRPHQFLVCSLANIGAKKQLAGSPPPFQVSSSIRIFGLLPQGEEEQGPGALPGVLPRFASTMACQTRGGVAGISMCVTPNAASASTIALIVTPSAGVVPPSLPGRKPCG
jgi:hypothetical protein